MSWEIFRPNSMTATIFKSKLLGLSKSVADAIETNYVELLYDKETNRMALKHAESSSITYPVRRGGKKTSVITINKFINHFNLEHTVGKRYSVTKENGLFVIDLNKPISEIGKQEGKENETNQF